MSFYTKFGGALVATVLFATTASATCMSNCGPTTPTTPTTPTPQRSLMVEGNALISGNADSQYLGTLGLNDVFKEGATSTEIDTVLSGFCLAGPCTDASVKAELSAFERGGAMTESKTDQSGETAGIMNAGRFQSLVNLNTDFDGVQTIAQGSGVAAFENLAVAAATGDHVMTHITSYGEGASNSLLGYDDKLCPNGCAAYTGQQTNAAKAGINLLSRVNGGPSGTLVGIRNEAKTTSAFNAGTLFSQTPAQQ